MTANLENNQIDKDMHQGETDSTSISANSDEISTFTAVTYIDIGAFNLYLMHFIQL